MDKIKINLIPPEVKQKAKKEAKRVAVVRISIGLLALFILMTVGVLGVIVYQSFTVQTLNAQVEQKKGQVGSLKDKEAIVFFLKDRIDTITKFSDQRYKQGEVYDLISTLIPPSINVVSLQVDKSDKVLIQGDTNTSTALDVFFSSLVDPKVNEGKIASVSVESLNRSQNGIIRFDLVLNMKEKAQ